MRFHNIQVLRLVTAVGVVVAHAGYYGEHVGGVPAGPVWWGTWKGLLAPTFFAVSGFVLTQALHACPPGRFLLARLLRVYPTYWVAAAVVMALMRYTVWPPVYAACARADQIGWSLTPRSPGSAFYPLGVEWTLLYEMALYLWMTAVVGLFGVRRGLPTAAVLWLVALVVKGVVWPGYGSYPLPTWGTVWFSAANVPFLLGILAYYLRDRGRRWRWPVLAALVGYFAVVPGWFATLEGQWFATAPMAAGVWFVAQIRQADAANPLVRLGEYTYGLYLAHAAILTGIFYTCVARGWSIGVAGVVLAGCAAVLGGLLFGWAEYRAHARWLRPLTKAGAGGGLRRAAGRVLAAVRPGARAAS